MLKLNNQSVAGVRIKPRDRVRISDTTSAMHNHVGQVQSVEPSVVYRHRHFCRVELDGVPFGFSCEQLEKVTCTGSLK